MSHRTLKRMLFLGDSNNRRNSVIPGSASTHVGHMGRSYLKSRAQLFKTNDVVS